MQNPFNLLYFILRNDHDVSVGFRKQGNALAAQLCGIHKLVVIAGGGGERGEEAESMYDRRRPPAPPGEPVWGRLLASVASFARGLVLSCPPISWWGRWIGGGTVRGQADRRRWWAPQDWPCELWASLCLAPSPLPGPTSIVSPSTLWLSSHFISKGFLRNGSSRKPCAWYSVPWARIQKSDYCWGPKLSHSSQSQTISMK